MPHVATEQYAEVAEQCTARSQSEPSTRTALLVESRHLGLLILATASRPFFLAAQREFRLDSAAAVSRWGGQGRGRRTGADFPLPRVVSQSEWVVVVPTDRRGSCRSPRHQPHNSRTASHGSSSLPGLGSRVFGSEAGASSFHGQLWNAGRAPRSLRRTTPHDPAEAPFRSATGRHRRRRAHSRPGDRPGRLGGARSPLRLTDCRNPFGDRVNADARGRTRAEQGHMRSSPPDTPIC